MALAPKIPPAGLVADLYEADFYLWLSENARLLRTGRLQEADIANIAEELEDTGRSERRALASHLCVLLHHLLKWQYQPSQRSGSWRGSVYNARRSAIKLLSESPSLRARLPELVSDEYPHARFNAANETGLPEADFPWECPYDVEALTDEGFWPD